MLEAWRNEIAGVWPDLDEPERLDAPPARRAAAVGVAVHLVAAAPHQRARPARSGPTRRARPGSARRWRTTGASWPPRGRRGKAADGRARRRGGRGAEQALPRRARGAAGLPGVPHGGLTGSGGVGSGTARRGRAGSRRSGPPRSAGAAARVQVGQIQVTCRPPRAGCSTRARPCRPRCGRGRSNGQVAVVSMASRVGSAGLRDGYEKGEEHGCVDLRLLAVRLTVIRPSGTGPCA